ncbi:MAG: sulfurtransferase TusA family protein [Desulfobacterales bacterium]
MGQNERHRLDLRGAIVPFTLLKASQTFKMINPGDTLEILLGDEQTRNDLFKILPDSSYELILMDKLGKDLTYRIRIRKR